MTYCVAASVSAGIVFASDSRTNAGVDHVATFGKMHVFETPGERVLVLLSAGNLASTQSVITLLRERAREGVNAAKTMYEVATLVGSTIREIIERDGPALQQGNIDLGCSFVLGGQIAGEPPRLFDIYPQGNFIEANRDTPYFQIGEIKYGKPILDRIIRAGTPLAQAVKCTLVSFDSTIKSNISVGLPIDLLVHRSGDFGPHEPYRFGGEHPYLRELRNAWSAGLHQLFDSLPDIDIEAP